ncbi:hypothetical protein B0H13DRAFT_2321877 [Mycena leptocephala]|nr:hypothetical protein B0H13DRAFT_2321877 [Mycena leptocephala]
MLLNLTCLQVFVFLSIYPVSFRLSQEFHIQDLDDRVRVLETRLAPPSSSNFSLLEMSNALAEQFTLIKDDHNGLDKAIKSQAKAQAMTNSKHELTIAELQTTIQRLESTIARLQLTPTARVSPPSHMHSRSPPRSLIHRRSRSPEQSANKRTRVPSENTAFIIIGPVKIAASTPALQVLQVYMDAHLPDFALPEPQRMNVISDPVQANHLRVFMSAADVRALRNAWVQGGHNSGSVKLVARGIDEAAGSQEVASGSGTSGGGNGFGYGRNSLAGSGISGRSVLSRR